MIAKPDWREAGRLERLVAQPAGKPRNAAPGGSDSAPRRPDRTDRPAAHSRRHPPQGSVQPKDRGTTAGAGSTDRIVAVGVSTGGVQAVQRLLSDFPADAPGVVIVQHMPPDFTSAFATRLNDDPKIAMEVAEAKHHDPIRPGRVLIIPGDQHGLVRRTGTGCRVELVDGPRLPSPSQRRSPVSLDRPGGRSPRCGPDPHRHGGRRSRGPPRDARGRILDDRPERGDLHRLRHAPRSHPSRRRQVHHPLDRIAAAVMAWHTGSDLGSVALTDLLPIRAHGKKKIKKKLRKRRKKD